MIITVPNLIKFTPLALVAVIFFLMTGCGHESIKGEGDAKTEPREVAAFTGITVDGDYAILGKMGKPTEVVIGSNPNILPYIQATVESGILTVKNDDKVVLHPTHTQNIWFTTEEFHTLNLSGDTQFQFLDLNSTDLDCNLSGSHKVLLKGKLTTLKVVTNGTTNFDARDVQVKDADIEINGSGIVAVNVTDNLKVKINGDGQVIYYNSKPKIEQTIKGAGQVGAAFGAVEQ